MRRAVVTVFSMRSVPRLCDKNHLQLPLSLSASREYREQSEVSVGRRAGGHLNLQVLLADAGNSSGIQRKGNVRHWKPLSGNAMKTVTKNTSLCMIIICKMQSRAV